MTTDKHGPSRLDELEVLRISDHEWRVSDPFAQENSAKKVIGFLEKRDGRYESTRISDGCSSAVFDTFGGALAFVAGPRAPKS